ncbi:MAG: hypothetical protein LBB56_00475 [Chitinispirillales bacterium]|nr:hypothetical protein [Chitinispirillales bacterium]
MTTTQIVLVSLTAAIIGFIMLSNKKSPGVCAKCGSKSPSLKNVDNQLICEKCSLELSSKEA